VVLWQVVNNHFIDVSVVERSLKSSQLFDGWLVLVLWLFEHRLGYIAPLKSKSVLIYQLLIISVKVTNKNK